MSLKLSEYEASQQLVLLKELVASWSDVICCCALGSSHLGKKY